MKLKDLQQCWHKDIVNIGKPLQSLRSCDYSIRRENLAKFVRRGITPTSRSEGAMNRENNESNERTRAKCLTRRARRQPRSRSLLFGGRVICLPRIIDESGRNARAFARAEAERKKRKRGALRQ